MIYISIALADDPGNRFIDTVDNAVKFIQGLGDELGSVPGVFNITESEKYVIQAVEMSEEEVNNLPEFQGF